MDLLPKNYKRKTSGVDRVKIARSKGFSIPGPKKKTPSFLGSKKISLLVLLLLIVALGLWAGFLFYRKNIEGKITDLRDEIKPLEEERDSEMIDKVSSFEKGISLIKEIIEEHIYADKIFELLEQNTLPQVAWSNFGLDVEQGKISLSGQAKSYTYLAKQIIAFEDSGLNQVQVSGINLSQEGGIEFSAEIGFDSEILKEQP